MSGAKQPPACPPACGALTGWRARVMDEIERSVKNPKRQTIIVLRFDGTGNCQVIPMASPAARIEMDGV